MLIKGDHKLYSVGLMNWLLYYTGVLQMHLANDIWFRQRRKISTHRKHDIANFVVINLIPFCLRASVVVRWFVFIPVSERTLVIYLQFSLIILTRVVVTLKSNVSPHSWLFYQSISHFKCSTLNLKWDNFANFIKFIRVLVITTINAPHLEQPNGFLKIKHLRLPMNIKKDLQI